MADLDRFVQLFQLPPAMVPYVHLVATEREIELVVALGEAAKTADQIAAMLRMSATGTESFLNNAFQREIITQEIQNGVTTYRPSRFYSRMDVLAMFENEAWRDIPAAARQALHEWQLQEYINLWKPGLDRIKQDPDAYIFVKNRDVLLLQEALEMVEAADDHVITRCDCRSIRMACNLPVDQVCVRLGPGARHTLELGQGRRVSKGEMKALVLQTDKAGLVHTGVRNWHGHEHEFWGFCNCCACCCYPILTGLQLGIAQEFYPRVHHIANRDLDACQHCGICVERCQFGAFFLNEYSAEIGGKPGEAVLFDATKCWGCGLCANTCPEGAIVMDPLRY